MQDILTEALVNDDATRGKYLTFKVHDGEYGIEISSVDEIIGIQAITPVPHTHRYVKGIINLRGIIVPIIDMRLRFNHEEMAYTDRTCIVVLSMEDMSIGLIVDEVQEVSYIADEEIQPPPKSTGNAIKNFFIKAIGRVGSSVKQLLDINKVFEIDETAPMAG